jgi:hypothetical protein
LLETISIGGTFGSNAGEYFGATGNISYATLTDNKNVHSGDYVFIDRVTYKSGASVPDSSATAILLGFGFAAVAFLRRRIAA